MINSYHHLHGILTQWSEYEGWSLQQCLGKNTYLLEQSGSCIQTVTTKQVNWQWIHKVAPFQFSPAAKTKFISMIVHGVVWTGFRFLLVVLVVAVFRLEADRGFVTFRTNLQIPSSLPLHLLARSNQNVGQIEWPDCTSWGLWLSWWLDFSVWTEAYCSHNAGLSSRVHWNRQV